MIFHSHQCIYLSVPKTGSTSIMKAFGLDWSHPDSQLMIHAQDDLNSLPTYFRFATIRNPFDRFISGWKYCDFTKDRSLMDVLTNLPVRELSTKDNDRKTEDFAYRHITITQKMRLFDLNDKLVTNFLVRYENLQSDFNLLCDMISKPRCVLSHENATKREPYRQYFDTEPEAKKLAEEYFHEDLEVFGYCY